MPRLTRKSIITVALASIMTVGGTTVATAAPASAEPGIQAVSPTILDCERFRPFLYRGVQGQAGCVAALQLFLDITITNSSITWDGIFGEETENHVILYQAIRGLGTDGKVGNQTWNQIEKDCYDRPGLSFWCNTRVNY